MVGGGIILLSNKYRITEEKIQIVLSELVERPVLDDNKNETGETKVVEKTLGYYSNMPSGRASAYSRIINSEISSLEVQTLEEILATVKRCEEQVVGFWEVKK